MNNSSDESALSLPQRAIGLVAIFLAMAIAEWRKLVADTAHAFNRSRDRRKACNPEGGDADLSGKSN